jgi:hypothetical protein
MARVSVQWNGNPPCGAGDKPYAGELYSLILNQKYFSSSVAIPIPATFVSEGSGGRGYERTYNFEFADSRLPTGFVEIKSCHVSDVQCEDGCCASLQAQIDAIELGAVAINTDATLTGDGSTSSPLSVVAQGAVADGLTITGTGVTGDPLVATGSAGEGSVADGVTIIGVGTAVDPFRSPVEPNREIYLTPNAVADDVVQVGSSEHPMDASTPELLQALQRQYPTDVTWRYLPGVFETFGWKKDEDQQLLNNVAHIGSGMGVTTLQLVGASSGGSTVDGAVLGNNFDGLTSNVTIRDITLDANAPGNPKFTSGNGPVVCVQVWGNRITCERVECIGFGTSNGAECFPMAVGRTRNWNSREELGMNTVSHCRFHSPHKTGNVGPLTALIVGHNGDGEGNPLFTAGSDIVTNCQFQDMKASETGFSVCHGVTAPVVQNCYFEGVDDCVYFEVQSPPTQSVRVDYGRLLVQDNVFQDSRFAIILRQSSPAKALGQLMVKGNTSIQRLPAGDYRNASFVVVLTGGDSFAAKSVVIKDNNVGYEEGLMYDAGRDHFLWMSYESGSSTNLEVIENLVMCDNIVDLRGYAGFVSTPFVVLNDHRRTFNAADDFIGNATIYRNITSRGFDMDNFLTP